MTPVYGSIEREGSRPPFALSIREVQPRPARPCDPSPSRISRRTVIARCRPGWAQEGRERRGRTWLGRSAVAPRRVSVPLAVRQHVQRVPDQGLVNGCRRQLQPAQTTQLMAQAFDTEAARPAQLEDQRLFFLPDLRRWRAMRRSALRAKSRSP